MKLLWIGSFLFFCWCGLLKTEETNLRPYRLINSDSLYVEKRQDEYVSLLSGNVHFFYGETEFFSDRAELYEKQKITKLIGNVKVKEDTLRLFSDRAEYFRIEDILHLRKDVFVQENHADSTIRTFQAGRASYHRKEEVFYAWDDVQVFDEREQFHGHCGELTYDQKIGYGYLRKKPVLYAVQEDSVQISAEKIEYFDEYKKVAATFNVRTNTNDFFITSNFFLYFSEQQRGIYLGDPRFYSDFADAKAQEFQLFFKDDTLEKAILTDSCIVEYKINEQDSIKQNWVQADSMRFSFHDGKLSKCQAFDHIDSYYLQPKTEKADFVENKVQGKRLVITFSNENQVETIHLKTKILGKYKFFKQ